ncbi:MAG TPA: T9SS type A sorting domain-containing protein [Ignavibacteria bacterium]|nr:T9SS type A sorting domain-containing protein [Ignavibacteria bacterium]
MMKRFFSFFLLAFFPILLSAQVIVTDDISSDVTWTANNEYILNGLVFVNNGATLSIEPGTVIKGRSQGNITTGEGASALVVRRGGKIMAEGTAANPIIFTSEFDDLSIPDDLTNADRGLWGGIIILGRATTNQPTTENQIEGIPSELDAKYGGNDDDDNSGVLRYVSIRHGGFSISGVPGDEINGLTMGAVGRGTTIEYIEVYANFDDGFEWFGGTVNTRYLVAAFCADDSFDYDQGWRGKNQFWFSVQGSDEAGRGGEHDGGDDCETCEPYAIPMIANATYIGSGVGATPAGDGNDRAIYFRDNAGGKYYNSIFTDFVGVGLKVEDITGEDSRSRLENGDLVMSNNYWWGFGAGNDWLTIASGDQWVVDHLAANNNHLVDPQLRGISRTTDKGLDPRPQLATTAVNVGDQFFVPTNYAGAFDPNNGLWTEGWTALSVLGYTPQTVVGIEEKYDSEIPVSFDLSQNYPNPFNPSTKIQFTMPEAGNVKLTVYNVLGQKVAELINDFKSAGIYTINWNAENLSSGMYIYKLESGANIITKKMTLLK